jgi:formyl-CoA transferase/CoA:oxalate CoA-transferase
VTGPLEGLRVLDLGTRIAAPFCAGLLGEQGAEVIKIEQPRRGDFMREIGPFVDGYSLFWAVEGRGRKSVTLDLRTSEGQDLFRRLAATADVVVENFRPGVADSLGVGYAALSKDNGGLIYCSINGFGQDGPYASRPALDIVLQAMGGVMDRQGRHGRPELLVVTIADTYAAALAVQSILAALIARGRDGVGQWVEVRLFEALIAAQGYRIISPADHVMLPGFDDTCPNGAFQCGDGAWLVIGIASDKSWHGLCAALDIPDIADVEPFATNPARVANREELLALLDEQFLKQTRSELLGRLEQAGVPSGPVRAVEELMTDQHVIESGTIIEMDHVRAGRIRTLGSVLHLSRTPTSTGGAAPILGEHEAQVLAELGYSDAEINGLANVGALGPARVPTR